MQIVTEPIHLERLWARCRPHGWRVSVFRCDLVANGRDDRFILSVYPRSNPRAAIHVKTTNLDSAAALILDRHGKALPGA